MRSTELLLAVALIGCGADPGPLPLVWLGRSGESTPASTGGSVFWVRADVAGASGPDVLVDTGAPVSILNPGLFGGAVRSGSMIVPWLTVGAVTLWKVPVIGIDEDLRLTPSGSYDGGVLGYTAFGQFCTSFDYRGRQVILGRSAPPDGVGDPVKIASPVQGGGVLKLPDGSRVGFPPSRVLVQTLVEGRTLTMLVDTGASWVALSSSVFSDLTGDGRARVSDEAHLLQGSSKMSVTRLRSVAIGALEVTRPVAAGGVGVDMLLDSLALELGRTVDGALGAPFLREFFVTMDYPAGRLELRRYGSIDHIHDDYVRVGFTLAHCPAAPGYCVGQVFDPSAAKTLGVLVGEAVLAVDGADITSTTPMDADAALLGDAGSSKTVTFGTRTLTVIVDDLLPLL